MKLPVFKKLQQLEDSISQYGFTHISLSLTGFIAASSLTYGFFYVKECGFDPTLFYSFSDYIDSYIFKSITFLSIYIFFTFTFLFFSPLIPWNRLPAYTIEKVSRFNSILVLTIVGLSYIYLTHITSHLPKLSFLNGITITFNIMLIVLGLTYDYKIIPKIVLTICFVSTISIHMAICDARNNIKNANNYTVEFSNGEKETVKLLASSSNYLLCISTSKTKEKKAIHTKFVKRLSPVAK